MDVVAREEEEAASCIAASPPPVPVVLTQSPALTPQVHFRVIDFCLAHNGHVAHPVHKSTIIFGEPCSSL